MPSVQELDELTKDELYDLAQRADLAGRSDMTKAELAAALAGEAGKEGSDDGEWAHSGDRSETGRATWTGAITFGLITIPVGLYTATEDRDISFHLLTGDDHSRVRNQRVSVESGEKVEWDELVRGFEYEKGHYVVFTDEELDQIPSESARTVEVVQFAPADQVDPLYFDRSYFVAPEETGVKAYMVLAGALEESGRVGVGKVTIRTKERPCTVRVHDGVIVLETMRWPDEIRVPAFDVLEGATDATESEIEMARQLIDALASDFDPSKLTDSYRERLEETIAAKIAGEEVAVASADESEPSKVVDLMEALKASVEASKTSKSA